MSVLKIFLLNSLFYLNLVSGNPLKIAIVDTGLDLKDERFSFVLCDEGHTDLTGDGIKDTMGHGTHVAGIIKQTAGIGNYCLLIVKVYSYSVQNYALGLDYAVKHGSAIVNISAGGYDAMPSERDVIQANKNVLFIAAAGNENVDIDIKPYYPASYKFKNVFSVGSINKEGQKSEFSNYGKSVTFQEMGENVISTLPDNKIGPMSGTSMSTAIKTGKIVRELLHGKSF